MLYSPTTGKRKKEPFNHINWVHTATKQPDFDLKQCFFGEHLLIEKTKPVAIVESEKTAVIASIYLPKFIWLAVGSLTNLNSEKCRVLKGRNITLFPDLNGFEKWSKKANELSHIAIFNVSDLLERKATESERKQGLDLADYLTKFNYKDFIQVESIEPAPAVQTLVEVLRLDQPEKIQFLINPEQPQPDNWEQTITELEMYFSEKSSLPNEIRLNQSTLVANTTLFIERHLNTVKSNIGNPRFKPYLERLELLKMHTTVN